MVDAILSLIGLLVAPVRLNRHQSHKSDHSRPNEQKDSEVRCGP